MRKAEDMNTELHKWYTEIVKRKVGEENSIVRLCPRQDAKQRTSVSHRDSR